MARSYSLLLYRAITSAAEPVFVWLRRRHLRGKGSPSKWLTELVGENLTHSPESERVVWIHAASVGESLSALPLIRHLLSSNHAREVILTTSTASARKLLPTLLPKNSYCQFPPIDIARHVDRFLDHWKPRAAIWIESELWPNLVSVTGSRKIPMAIINARMSERSYQRWQYPIARSLAASLLSHFDIVLGQTNRDADRFRQLGAFRSKFVGNLKSGNLHITSFNVGTSVSAENATLRKRMRTAIGDRPVWIACSTHRGEEELLLRVHARLRKSCPLLGRVLLFLIPRHPERSGEVAKLCRAHSLEVSLHESGNSKSLKDVYLVDTLGEATTFFSLGPVAFIGGSLVRVGGHNILEPLAAGCSVLYGPFMDNSLGLVQAISDALGVSDEGSEERRPLLAAQVTTEDRMYEAVKSILLESNTEAALRKQAALNLHVKIASDHSGRIEKEIDTWLASVN